MSDSGQAADAKQMVSALMNGEPVVLVTDDKQMTITAQDGAVRFFPSGEATVTGEREAREIAAFFLAYAEWKSGKSAGHCWKCLHPWDDHADDGCQAQIALNGGSYDCNCPEKRSE